MSRAACHSVLSCQKLQESLEYMAAKHRAVPIGGDKIDWIRGRFWVGSWDVMVRHAHAEIVSDLLPGRRPPAASCTRILQLVHSGGNEVHYELAARSQSSMHPHVQQTQHPGMNHAEAHIAK